MNGSLDGWPRASVDAAAAIVGNVGNVGAEHRWSDASTVEREVMRRRNRRWASSGLMGLTGPVDRPLLVDTLFFDRWRELCNQAMIALANNDATSAEIRIRPRSLLTARARRNGLERRGPVSANGHCHLLATADGHVALNLARRSDVELLPALLEQDVELSAADAGDANKIQQVLTPLMATAAGVVIVDRGRLLGLPICRVPDAGGLNTQSGGGPAAPFGLWRPTTPRAQPIARAPRIVDLAPLWAGPLAAQLLANSGSAVTRVESVRRPDGLRRGDPVHWHELNDGKELHLLDLPDSAAIADLQALITNADIVISGARPRVFAQWGVDVPALVANGLVWVAITGHGAHGSAAERVAFGDDAAVAGGLVAWSSGQPNFIGDAVGDPVAGVTAALAASTVWQRGGGALVDVAMANAVRWLIGDDPLTARMPEMDAHGQIFEDGPAYRFV